MKELIEVQKKLSVPKGRKQQNYSYRSTEDILTAVKKIMPEGCFLTMADSVQNIGDRNYICSSATFSNGEDSIHSTGYAWEPEKIASMSMPQITGSCSSYARKTALCGLFMIDDSKDVDSLTEMEKGGSRGRMATPDQIEQLAVISETLTGSIDKKDMAKRKWCNDAVDHGVSYADAAEAIRRFKNA